ncbi:unnamed protein product [Eruca vesicaria subsp. sativa]|uniref:Uncharacterized protein n=1 Tax=Eruca vesicaria subsp. sativa TaxID=29727 RepID=A0ABC8M0I1_ERUVS|nr:unnamed protein product [Eruca vesicaria subsp. sativa]
MRQRSKCLIVLLSWNNNWSRSALDVSFFIAGVAAALSACCYAELASRCPSSGSAYHYDYICLGEGIACLVGWELVLDYTICGSAIARGISPNLVIPFELYVYLNLILTSQTIPRLGIVVDPCAALLIIIVTILLCFGIKESSLVQEIVASANLSRLAGLDMIFVMVIVGLIPYYTLDPDTPISVFGDSGMQWAAYILTTGATTALCASLLGSLLAQPRIFMAMARDGLLPGFFPDEISLLFLCR